jgi:hypothetical protein
MGGVLIVEIEEMKYDKICCGVEKHLESSTTTTREETSLLLNQGLIISHSVRSPGITSLLLLN